MLYKYKAILNTGEQRDGSIEAVNIDTAISSLQAKGLIISSIKPAVDNGNSFNIEISFFNKVSTKDVVILSRQLATLFDAQVSALRIFRIMAEQTENKKLAKHLFETADDIQGGMSISQSLSKHPDVFSDFYVNMVLSGEESGKLNESFNYLADYLDRTYEVVSKAKNALVYPLFVILTFIGVMVLMLTVIIPKIALIIKDSGQEVPIYTKAVLFLSDTLRNNGLILLLAILAGGVALYKYSKTKEGSRYLAKLKISLPYLGNLYRKLYLSRIADNLNTMIISGIPILRALEITSSVVDNEIYKNVINTTIKDVREGVSLSGAFAKHTDEIPSILVQMVKVGEETGELGNILKTLSKFYQREVTNAVDTMVGLIEPIMIVALGLGVGSLLAAVLMPIYNIASAG
jgi:type IV pilus assembly protein PilC